ncbi:MAG TPA: hypothetical protein VFE05_24775 [Longimicrobiaceae bacterium]|jgi:hypothetical protein|nr:hypothetical protein [Longimicrobiaceae bacterium]
MILENRTARRIAIPTTDGKDCIILPPFGQRIRDASYFGGIAYQRWVDYGLAELYDPAAPATGSMQRRRAIRSGLGNAVWLSTFAMVLVVAFGVPATLLRVSLAPSDMHDANLGRVAMLVFIGLVAALPALMYFLFDHQQSATLRTRFYREVIRLDPNLQTMGDAEAQYGNLVDEVYGSGKRGDSWKLTTVPILTCTLLLALGWCVALLPVLDSLRPIAYTLEKTLRPQQGILTYAFLGVYFFALNLVFRRYVRSDLGPKAYSHITTRLIVAAVLTAVVAALAQVGGREMSSPSVLLFAFVVGFLPETALTALEEWLQGSKWLGKKVPSFQETYPLSRLQGITLYDRARLVEEGIENVENLAHCNLYELMLRTRIPTARLVDLVDQSILQLHLRDPAGPDFSADAPNERSIALLLEHGIRTATELEEAHAAATARGEAEPLLRILGPEQGLPRLLCTLNAVQRDEWITNLRHWRAWRSRCSEVNGLLDFYPEKVKPGLSGIRISPVRAPADRRTHAFEPL